MSGNKAKELGYIEDGPRRGLYIVVGKSPPDRVCLTNAGAIVVEHTPVGGDTIYAKQEGLTEEGCHRYRSARKA